MQEMDRWSGRSNVVQCEWDCQRRSEFVKSVEFTLLVLNLKAAVEWRENLRLTVKDSWVMTTSLAKLDSVAARARINSTRMQPHVFMWSNFQYWVWDPQLVSVLYRIVRSRQDTPRVGQVCGLWGQCIIKNWDGASVLDGPISKVFIINSGFEKRKGKYLLPWLMIDMVWALVRRIIIIICK